jgi:hypothetical protein
MRFRLSTILLLVALVAVCLGWFVDHTKRNQHAATYLANISAPLENSTYAPDDTIRIVGDFLDGNMLNKSVGDKPIVIVHFLKPTNDYFVVHQSGTATVDAVSGHPDRYKVKFDLFNSTPFAPGQYVVRMKCFIRGQEVATPSRMINIETTVLPGK